MFLHEGITHHSHQKPGHRHLWTHTPCVWVLPEGAAPTPGAINLPKTNMQAQAGCPLWDSWHSILLDLGMFIIYMFCTFNDLHVSHPWRLFWFFVFILVQVCSNNHAHTTWVSQPQFPYGIHLGDVQMASSIVMSGNNFEKVAHFSRFLRAPCVDAGLFNGLQRNYITRAINTMWEQQLAQTIAKYKNEPIIVCGKNCACIFTMLCKLPLVII